MQGRWRDQTNRENNSSLAVFTFFSTSESIGGFTIGGGGADGSWTCILSTQYYFCLKWETPSHFKKDWCATVYNSFLLVDYITQLWHCPILWVQNHLGSKSCKFKLNYLSKRSQNIQCFHVKSIEALQSSHCDWPKSYPSQGKAWFSWRWLQIIDVHWVKNSLPCWFVGIKYSVTVPKKLHCQSDSKTEKWTCRVYNLKQKQQHAMQGSHRASCIHVEILPLECRGSSKVQYIGDPFNHPTLKSCNKTIIGFYKCMHSPFHSALDPSDMLKLSRWRCFAISCRNMEKCVDYHIHSSHVENMTQHC